MEASSCSHHNMRVYIEMVPSLERFVFLLDIFGGRGNPPVFTVSGKGDNLRVCRAQQYKQACRHEMKYLKVYTDLV